MSTYVGDILRRLALTLAQSIYIYRYKTAAGEGKPACIGPGSNGNLRGAGIKGIMKVALLCLYG